MSHFKTNGKKSHNMDLKGKRLLLLGGSRISCEIIRHARKYGIVTGVTDWYPLEKSPAKAAADEAYYVSTSDIDAMVSLIQEKKFDGVFTGFTDSVLPYYGEMCEKAGIPAYGTKEQFEVFIDKHRYKKLMREFGLPVIPEYHIDLTDFENSIQNVEYPLLVKPSDGSGARGITVCHNAEELKGAIDFANGMSKTKDILVEKYVDEPEATVFWLFVDGEYYVTLLGNRHVKHNQDGVIPLPAGYTYPASVLPRFMEEELPKWKALFASLGIKNGMMFMQSKIVDGQLYIYDIGYRLTGSLEYINIQEMCGFDPIDMLIFFALTGDMGVPDIAQRVDPMLGKKYSYNVSLLCKPGKIAKITGIEEVKKLPGVIDAVIAHPPGDEITRSMRGLLAQITVRVLGRADSIEAMKKEMFQIQDTIEVFSDTGEKLNLAGVDDSDFDGTILTWE